MPNSIVIPVRNEQAHLRRCLRALEPQLGRDELIVVDDASSDGSGDVAREFGALVITLPERQGAAAARNAGSARALGEILLFTDADCEPAHDWCREMARALESPTVAAAYGVYRTRQEGWVARLAQLEFEERYARLSGRETIDFFATHSAAVRRWVFRQAGGFRADLRGNEDVELAFRLSARGDRLVFEPRAVVYHEHPTTLFGYFRVKFSRGFWRTVAYAAHPGKAVTDAYTPFGLKLQVALMALSFLLLPLVRVHQAFMVAFGLVVVAWIAAGIPFACFVARRNVGLAIPALGFAWLRSAALAAGVAVGSVRVVLRGQRKSEESRS